MALASVIDSLKIAVENRSLLPNVLECLLPGGKPFDCEGQLWDYKADAPVLEENPTEAAKTAHRIATGDLVKDAIAFHNAYGGYIVFGVRDKGNNRITGVTGVFNCADFNKSLQSYTGVSIECLYNSIEFTSAKQSLPVRLGLLLIPRRPAGTPPVKPQRKGPEKTNGKRCFQEEVYVRVRDECRAAANTHEDWLFLHSDRLPPEQAATPARTPIQSHLPIRDADLVEFVGRTEQLASLRQWISDARSPIRLITGIGGLGKTTLAYRFAEEVSETGAGEVEAIIWLTAKQQTYSALLGKMVPTSRVDFSDLTSLFIAILKTLHYEFPVMEEEPSFAEVGDRLVEALSIVPSLIIVDDLDTLLPDEQKETVAALNSLAARTVGRELPPSRVLMTSRLDQGLPLTAIVKIHGLDRKDFAVFVNNLCGVFKIAPYREEELDNLFAAASGSPLFAASILRLIKLGEDRRDVVEKWKGIDGEEVRSFAFRRELSRLSGIQSRVLYAILLLGETSLNDVAEVLGMHARGVRDQVSELQTYHLVATITRAQGDSAISVPNELVAVIDLVREQLGSTAKAVEEAVARAHARSGSQERRIGTGIRSIARLWAEARSDEALVVAQELRRDFPDNGDVACVVGAALLRVKPAKSHEADRELERAVKLGCTKAELLPNIIQAKTAVEDWVGLKEFTGRWISNEANRDIALSAYLQANKQLIEISRTRGDKDRVAGLAIESVERITAKIRRRRLEVGYFNVLVNQRFEFARAYIDAVDRENIRPGDRLKVFEAVGRLASADVIVVDLLKKGVGALEQWWHEVEKRPVADLAACRILNRMLEKLQGMEQQIKSYNGDVKFVEEIQIRRRDLEYRGGALQASLG